MDVFVYEWMLQGDDYDPMDELLAIVKDNKESRSVLSTAMSSMGRHVHTLQSHCAKVSKPEEPATTLRSQWHCPSRPTVALDWSGHGTIYCHSHGHHKQNV